MLLECGLQEVSIEETVEGDLVGFRRENKWDGVWYDLYIIMPDNKYKDPDRVRIKHAGWVKKNSYHFNLGEGIVTASDKGVKVTKFTMFLQ